MVVQSLELMMFGLGGVFFALAILYASVKIIVKVFPFKAEGE
jgi:Na+-transporting methylmalonyl-CoA/oxaloacetate decarboxylase gamma subunit